jgi:hypothetical protein
VLNEQGQQQQRTRSTDSLSSSLTIRGNARNAAGHNSTVQASAAERAPKRDSKIQEIFDCLDEQLEDVSAIDVVHSKPVHKLTSAPPSGRRILPGPAWKGKVSLQAVGRSDIAAGGTPRRMAASLLRATRLLKERILPESGEGAEQKKIFRSDYKREPHRFGAANRKIELALCEYYVYLGSISNYCLINKAGFDKCAKKIELDLGVVDCRPMYRIKVDDKGFGHAYALANLQTKTEMLYAQNFEDQHSPKKAAHRLRALTRPGEAHPFAVARAGFFLGMAVVMTALGSMNGKPRLS